MVPGAIFGFVHGNPASALWFLQLLFAWAMGVMVRRELDRVRHTLPAGPGSTTPPGPLISPVARLSSLTRRELEVLRLMARGHSNVELAELLHIGQGTVKTHVARVLAKLELHNRVQAVVLAYESGLIRPQVRVEEAGAGKNLP
jgi:DNA-binding CsgD family transcriptional regulator